MFENVESHLRDCIARGLFPGAQYVIGEQGQVRGAGALGLAVIDPQELAATNTTLYDLASLTKPLVTTLLAAIFVERGLLDLSAPVSIYLDEFRDTAKGDITVTDLLTHTSGLEAWRPLYLEAKDQDDVVAAIARRPRTTTVSPAVVYSDLNFILLGFILERLEGVRLDRLAQREIIAPLALSCTMFNPPPALRLNTAATERGQNYERNTVAKTGVVCPLPDKESAGSYRRSRQPLRRKELIWGEVHDGNAYFLDGVAGHAGLFSTATEVLQIANQFLSGSQLLSETSLAGFVTNFTAGRGDARSLGWMLAATKDSSAGPGLPPQAFGHTGFTGTSLWLCPDDRRVFVLLTNRVHPEVRDSDMKPVRQRFHELAVEALDRR